MSGPAFDALSQKRKKIATELSELETRASYRGCALAALISDVVHEANCFLSHIAFFCIAFIRSQIYNMETEYCGQADFTSFGTVLKVDQ